MKLSLRSSILIAVLCSMIFGIGFTLGLQRTQVQHLAWQFPAAAPPAPGMVLASYQEPIPAPVQIPVPTVPAPGTALTLGATIIGLAALVTTVLQGIKGLFPQIGGWGARAIAAILAVAGAITAAPAGQPPLVTGGAAITAALGAMGIHGLFNGTPQPAPASK